MRFLTHNFVNQNKGALLVYHSWVVERKPRYLSSKIKVAVWHHWARLLPFRQISKQRAQSPLDTRSLRLIPIGVPSLGSNLKNVRAFFFSCFPIVLLIHDVVPIYQNLRCQGITKQNRQCLRNAKGCHDHRAINMGRVVEISKPPKPIMEVAQLCFTKLFNHHPEDLRKKWNSTKSGETIYFRGTARKHLYARFFLNRNHRPCSIPRTPHHTSGAMEEDDRDGFSER